MSIDRIFVRDVETAGPQEMVINVARRLRDQGLGTMIIVDAERRPMGIVTDRDIAVRLVAAGDDPAVTPVRAIMTPMPTTVLRESSVESVLGSMRMGHLRRLPVVDGLGRLLGIVTLDDLLRFLAEEFRDVEHLLEAEAPRKH